MSKNGDLPVIIYDGDCNLCRQAVRFMKGPVPVFKFIPSSDPGSAPIMEKYGISSETTDKTVLLIEDNRIYIKSTAIIKALQRKGGFWQLSGLLLLFPAFIRNIIYDWVAQTRKKSKTQH